MTTFVTVYECGSVTAAAQELSITQSTVSHGLNRLREITGNAMFVPVGRGITPQREPMFW
ncbi:helix-turn-helix domain-containing protein [Phaeobacter sp. C3_T13_0]|uniref:helix-turn-helix domain-containing protein n=1 Tax=Phaeobacter cretensis TaxID=3342641 RepID=UPI0039BC22C8